MWFVWFYLVAYASLVLGAVVALWRAGALAEIPVLWTVIALLLAAGLGALVALTFLRRPSEN